VDVDLVDFAALQSCFGVHVAECPLQCGLVDLDLDGIIGVEDFTRALRQWTGPPHDSDD